MLIWPQLCLFQYQDRYVSGSLKHFDGILKTCINICVLRQNSLCKTAVYSVYSKPRHTKGLVFILALLKARQSLIQTNCDDASQLDRKVKLYHALLIKIWTFTTIIMFIIPLHGNHMIGRLGSSLVQTHAWHATLSEQHNKEAFYDDLITYS